MRHLPRRTVLHGPADLRFWRGQVWPRRRRLVLDRHLWAAGAFAAGLAAATWSLPLRDVAIAAVASAALAYAAISFGACVTGAVLALTLPASKQRALWATTAPAAGSGFSHLSELIFVFTWAAVTQLAVVVAACAGYVLGGNGVIGPAHPLWTHVALAVIAYFIGAYAVLHLFTVVSTLSLLGAVLIAGEHAAAERSADTK